MTERLVTWREALGRRFHFEPAVTADPRDVQRVDRELAARRTRYMKELRAAIIALEKRINAIADERRALWQQLEGIFNQRMLARRAAQRRNRPSLTQVRCSGELSGIALGMLYASTALVTAAPAGANFQKSAQDSESIDNLLRRSGA